MKMKLLKLVFGFVAGILLVTTSCKIVKHSEINQQDGGTFGVKVFNAKEYAATIWDEKVLPRIDGKAEELSVLIDTLKSNEKAACDKYGYRVGLEGSFYNIAVKGKIKILSVNTESRNGLAEADIEPYDGKKDITLQIGPVFRGTAIRDYLDFVSINTFENQVDFAKLGTELNLCVRDKVLNDIDFTKIIGKECSITGVFTYDKGADNIVVVPVKFAGLEN